MHYVTKNLEETYALAEKFIKTMTSSVPERDGACVVLLIGDLGSGKTSFVQGVARALGVTEHVTSPTFVVMKNYKLSTDNLPAQAGYKLLVHIDAYRLHKDDASVLALDRVFADRENIVLIEWPEHLAIEYPEDSKKISFKFVDDTKREIEF